MESCCGFILLFYWVEKGSPWLLRCSPLRLQKGLVESNTPPPPPPSIGIVVGTFHFSVNYHLNLFNLCCMLSFLFQFFFESIFSSGLTTTMAVNPLLTCLLTCPLQNIKKKPKQLESSSFRQTGSKQRSSPSHSRRAETLLLWTGVIKEGGLSMFLTGGGGGAALRSPNGAASNLWQWLMGHIQDPESSAAQPVFSQTGYSAVTMQLYQGTNS